MILLNVLATLLFFPLYLAIRWPYFKLPIGPDTGYYVSNHTIVHRKFSFSRGWNARYAMCSKFLPECFLSMIYLKYGHKKYNFAWRFAFSLYNYLTAISVGLLAHAATQAEPVSYLAGLVSYGLISSEPDYGIYYESSEQFEILFQTSGTYFILLGMQTADPLFSIIGAGLWFVDVFLIKITGIVSAGPLLIGLLVYTPAVLPYIAIEFLIFLSFYLGLFIKSNKNPLEVIKTELGHQAHYSRYEAGEVKVAHGLMIQLFNKLKMIKRILTGNPFIPLVAFLGLVWSLGNIAGITQLFLFLYLLGIILKLCVSFLPMWWYQIPLLPTIALFSSFALIDLASKGLPGEVLIGLFLAAWLYLNVRRVQKMNVEQLNQYTWKIHPEMGILHSDLQKIVQDIRGIINKDSLLVYGYPSFCAMAGQSYDINFLTAISYMDSMNPNWNIELHANMVKNPPSYIFDMLPHYAFDPEAVYENLGLHYQRIKSWRGNWGTYNLYQFLQQIALDRPNPDFRSLVGAR